MRLLRDYVDGLSRDAEDRVLTTNMRPGSYDHHIAEDDYESGPCIVGVVNLSDPNMIAEDRGLREMHKNVELCTTQPWHCCVECRYDRVCAKYGRDVINNAIRLRILRNRLRRVLMPSRFVEKPQGESWAEFAARLDRFIQTSKEAAAKIGVPEGFIFIVPPVA